MLPLSSCPLPCPCCSISDNSSCGGRYAGRKRQHAAGWSPIGISAPKRRYVRSAAPVGSCAAFNQQVWPHLTCTHSQTMQHAMMRAREDKCPFRVRSPVRSPELAAVCVRWLQWLSVQTCLGSCRCHRHHTDDAIQMSDVHRLCAHTSTGGGRARMAIDCSAGRPGDPQQRCQSLACPAARQHVTRSPASF